METVVEKVSQDVCTGCGLCQAICPHETLMLHYNKDGFLVPIVCNDNCDGCNQCVEWCPTLRRPPVFKRYKDPKVYAAWSLDPEIRRNSTSGGIFSELAKQIFKEDGWVSGAQYTSAHNVVHSVVYGMEGLLLLRQSKYVQSKIDGVYQYIRWILQLTERKIAFCGTPCQVAALYNFVGDHPNLYTFDFICRGANSYKAYESYLQMLEKRYKSPISKVWFKNKTKGWNNFSTRVDFENGDYYIADRRTDLFMHGYIVRNLYMRPSCYNCQYRNLPHHSDITLADFWGVKKGLDSDEGTSLVFINSTKGEKLFNKIKDYIYYEPSTVEAAIPGNSCIFKNPKKDPQSDLFLRLLDTMPFDKALDTIKITPKKR